MNCSISAPDQEFCFKPVAASDIFNPQMNITDQIYSAIVISLAIASISWTVTQEEIFREPREYCRGQNSRRKNFLARKFFYVFLCEYCFSHWVTAVMLAITDLRLVFPDRRGLLVSFFVLPWLANQWMSIYRRLRVGIKYENVKAETAKEKLAELEETNRN